MFIPVHPWLKMVMGWGGSRNLTFSRARLRRISGIRGGYNDRPDISECLAGVYLKFKQLNVPAELHIYAGSGHGFGLRANEPKPAGTWIERFEECLADSGFLKTQ